MLERHKQLHHPVSGIIAGDYKGFLYLPTHFDKSPLVQCLETCVQTLSLRRGERRIRAVARQGVDDIDGTPRRSLRPDRAGIPLRSLFARLSSRPLVPYRPLVADSPFFSGRTSFSRWSFRSLFACGALRPDRPRLSPRAFVTRRTFVAGRAFVTRGAFVTIGAFVARRAFVTYGALVPGRPFVAYSPAPY